METVMTDVAWWRKAGLFVSRRVREANRWEMVGYARNRTLENAYYCSRPVRATHHRAGISVLHPPYRFIKTWRPL